MTQSTTKTAVISGLSKDKQQLVQHLTRDVRMSGLTELDINRTREDYYGIHSDIVQELEVKCKGKIMDFYALSEVLDKIAQLTTPEDAYLFGWQERQDGVGQEQGFIAFTRDMIAAIEASGLAQKRDDLFHGLCEALGDARWLMTEFIELHGRVNVEQYYIHHFYDLGYSDTRKEDIA